MDGGDKGRGAPANPQRVQLGRWAGVLQGAISSASQGPTILYKHPIPPLRTALLCRPDYQDMKESADDSKSLNSRSSIIKRGGIKLISWGKQPHFDRRERSRLRILSQSVSPDVLRSVSRRMSASAVVRHVTDLPSSPTSTPSSTDYACKDQHTRIEYMFDCFQAVLFDMSYYLPPRGVRVWRHCCHDKYQASIAVRDPLCACT